MVLRSFLRGRVDRCQPRISKPRSVSEDGASFVLRFNLQVALVVQTFRVRGARFMVQSAGNRASAAELEMRYDRVVVRVIGAVDASVGIG